jgi:hypothetical protein
MTEPGEEPPALARISEPGGSMVPRKITQGSVDSVESLANLAAHALTVHRPLILSEAPPGASNAAVLEGPRVAVPSDQVGRAGAYPTDQADHNSGGSSTPEAMCQT